VQFPQAHHILFDCQGINAIDATGVQVLRDMISRLRENGVELMFVRVKYPVLRKIELAGLVEVIGEHNFFHMLDDARAEVFARIKDGPDYVI
jgi:SulP family sulfate permease